MAINSRTKGAPLVCSGCLRLKRAGEFSPNPRYPRPKAECKKCLSVKSLARYHADAAYREKQVVHQKTPEGRRVKREYRRRLPTAHRLWLGAKHRATARGTEFTIAAEDVTAGEFCPCCGVRLQQGEGRVTPLSASLDRIDNAKGYVPGNVWVICYRCNQIKSVSTPYDLRRIADAVEARLVAQ